MSAPSGIFADSLTQRIALTTSASCFFTMKLAVAVNSDPRSSLAAVIQLFGYMQ